MTSTKFRREHSLLQFGSVRVEHAHLGLSFNTINSVTAHIMLPEFLLQLRRFAGVKVPPAEPVVLWNERIVMLYETELPTRKCQTDFLSAGDGTIYIDMVLSKNQAGRWNASYLRSIR
jgi:hypothetical protein